MFVIPPPIQGTFLHSFGAMSAAACYTPQKMVKGWSWQTYWLTQASFCWFLLPIIGASITIPNLFDVLSEAPKEAMLLTFALGVVYGVGGISFGLAIKHVGFSLTYAIAIGISCVVGTFVGPLVGVQMKRLLAEEIARATGEPVVIETLGQTLSKPGAGFVVTGIVVGVLGTVLCGIAGRFKEIELDKATGETMNFNFGKGLALCLVAGFLSALYGVAINDTGAPISAIAAAKGADGWETNVVYIFANTGAFLTTVVYTVSLIVKQKTIREFVAVEGISRTTLAKNYFWSVLTGCLWYSQFLFYGVAHVKMGDFEFSSWAIHMIMLILFSSLLGLAFKEWKRCGARAVTTIVLAIAILCGAVLTITYGNYKGSDKKEEEAVSMNLEFPQVVPKEC